MQQILDLSNEFCSKLASDPASLSDFVRQSVKELTSLSKLIKPLNDYGSLLTSKKLLEAASSGESSPCYSDNDEEDLSKKTRNKTISLYEIGQMFLDTSSTIEITQVTQDGSWYSWILLHGLQEEEHINGLQKLLDKHLKLKYENIKTLIYKGKKSLVIQCKDHFSAQKTFHFLDEDFYAKAYIKKRWPVIRFYNRMAEPKYMAQFYGIILKNLPNDCTVETITNLIKMNCPSVSCLSIEIPTKIEDTVATVIRTKNLEDAEMLALTLNDLMSENTTIQAGLHPSCSLKQENLAKGPFKEIKGGPGQNTTTGSEQNQGQTKNNVKDLLSMFKSGNKKDLKNEGYQNQRPVSLDPREREKERENVGNSHIKSPSWLKNNSNQKMEVEEVRVNLTDKQKAQEDSSQILYSPTRQSPRYQTASSPGTKILYDDQTENNQKAELLMTNTQHNVQVNNPLNRQMPQEQGLPPNMHHHGPNTPNFPGQYNNMIGPGPGMPPNNFPLLEHQRPLMEDFHRQNNNIPEIYRRPIQENNIPNINHPQFNDRVPFPPHQNFPHQNPYMGHNIPHQQHMFYDNNEGPIDMRNPNMNSYPQQPPREMVNQEIFTPEDAKMRPKYKRMIVKGPLYPTLAFKKKMMQNPSMQMSDKYSIPEDRKNKVSKISLKKLWQPKYITPYREMRSMNTRYLMNRLQRMAMREAPLINRLNTITGFEGPVVFRQQNQQKQPDTRQEQKVISTQINEWKLDINTITRPLPIPQNISIADMYPPVNRMKPNAVEREYPNARPGTNRNNEGYKKNNKEIGPEQGIPKNTKNFSKLPYWATRILDNRQMEENEFLQRRLIERSWQEAEKPIKPVNTNPPVPKTEPIPVQKAQEKKIEARSMEQASQENANYIQQQLNNSSDKDSSSEWKILFNVEPPKPNPPSGLPPKKLNEKMAVTSNVVNKREPELNLNNSKPQMKPSAPSQPINRPQNAKKSEKIEEETEVRRLNNQTKKSESDKEKDVASNPIGQKPISLEKYHLNRTGFQRLKQNLLDFQRKSNDSQNFKSWYLDSYGPHDEEEESESSSSSDDRTILPVKKKIEAKKEAEKANQSVEKEEKAQMESESLMKDEKLKTVESKGEAETPVENSWLINYHTKPKTPAQKKMVVEANKNHENFKEDGAAKLRKKGESEKLSLKLPVKSNDKAPAEEAKKTNADQAGSKVAASPQHYSPQILLNQTFSSFSAYPMPQNLVMNHSVPGADSKSKTEPEKLKDDQNKANNKTSKEKEQNNSNNTNTPTSTPAPIPSQNPPNQMTFTSHISHVPAMGYMYFPTVSSTITYSSLMMNMMPPHYPQPTVISDPAAFNPQMMVYHNNMIMNPLVNTPHPTSYYMHPNITNENKPTSKKAKNRKDLKKLTDKRPYDDVNILSGQKRTHQSFLSEAEAGTSFTDNEVKSPEAYPEPEGTPPSMPVEPPSGNERGNSGSSKRVIRDGVDCDAKNIHESL